MAHNLVAADRVITYWRCDEVRCKEIARVPLTDIPEIGTPVCSECELDMVLMDEVEIEQIDPTVNIEPTNR